VRALRAKGATLKATEQPIDTSTATGKCFLDRLGVFAQGDTLIATRIDRLASSITQMKRLGRSPASMARTVPRKCRPLCRLPVNAPGRLPSLKELDGRTHGQRAGECLLRRELQIDPADALEHLFGSRITFVFQVSSVHARVGRTLSPCIPMPGADG
jgi:hypothetical protein